MSGSDVSSLQTFLNSEYSNFYSSYITGYFGSLTQAAVEEWQASHGIVSSGSPSTTGWGVVGPRTRAALVNCSSSQTSQTTLPQGTITSPLGTVSPNSPLIPGPYTGGGGSSTGGGSGTGGGGGTVPPTPPTPQSCTQNGVTLQSGQSATFYSDAGVNFGDSCANYAQTRTCTNGTLSGDSTYQFASCSVGQPNACSFNNQSIASGQSVTAYQSSSVAYGNQCVAQMRTCSNGTLSGTYQYTSCSVQTTPPLSAPSISSFTASPSSITAGQSATLSWSASNATSLSISGIGSVTGSSITITPSQTTTYTLTATNSAGSMTAQTTVTVTSAPPTPPALPTPSITVIAPTTQSNMYFNNWSATPIMNAEITPWALQSGATGGWHTFLVSTASTYFCSTPDNIFALAGPMNITDSAPCYYKEGEALNASNAAQANTLPMWKRDYYGAMSGQLLQTGSNSWTLYMINHGEMENDDPTETPGLPYCVPAPDIGYGALPCTAADWWGSYNAFVGMSSFPWTQAGLVDNGSLTTDYGPIAWPSNGYIQSLDGGKTWIKATDGGVRTPTSIIANGYIYVYYEDTSQGADADGRGPGIKVIRAPLTSSGIDPNSFVAYYDGSFQDPALPPGFTISNYYTKWSVPGGRSSDIFPGDIMTTTPTPGTGRTDMRRLSDVVSFSVAKVDGTDWYLGVGYDLSKGVTLRLSKDLVNWSDPTVVPGTQSNYWSGNVDLQTVPLLYPRPANADGDSDTDIDPTNFYIIGTQTATHNGTPAKVVNVIHLELNLNPSS